MKPTPNAAPATSSTDPTSPDSPSDSSPSSSTAVPGSSVATASCSEPAAPSSSGSHSVTRLAWGVAGLVCFGLGAVGAFLPILPTTPFLLVAAFCFARSSERLNTWFKGTTLYKKVLADYVAKRSMTVKAKLTVVVPVTIVMGIGFALMGRVPVGRIVLAVVWVAHLVYFGFVVKTERA